ncbi:MAG: O-antigen ligase family protein [Polynucleobacter sp.]|nr:O-antigen ligase family protein [Polynucleobacter sp.]
MVFGAKTSIKANLTADFMQLSLAIFALLSGMVASVSVLLNNIYFWDQSHHYINPYLFLIAFLLGAPRKTWGLMGCIFLLPLSAGLGNQANAYLGTSFLVLPNAGLDLAAGLFLGSCIAYSQDIIHFFKNKRGSGCDLNSIGQIAPWPVALVIVMITVSTAIAISRNVYQSAASTSLKGLLFNLVHFRPIGWHDDYMPISDWIAYALAVVMIVLVIGYLKDKQNKNQIIFRPIIAGLIVAALMGVLQAITGLGLPENLLSFRRDQFGFAVIGFQPDLHAFAGHMLLGVVGLWGYFYSGISKLEQKFILLAVALGWLGLILSKSRALLLIALVAMLIWLVWYLWQKKRRFFLPTIVLVLAVFSIFLALIFNYSNSLGGIPVLSWLGELANEFKSRDLTSWSLLSGIFGSRFEIWEAAIRMWWEFPLMGIGQGNFYRLSDIASFSKSHFLILNHGENAHNYFLQTLTETGVIGVAFFSLALLAPFFGVKNRRVLIPAVIAIFSLFLGNIFSHSFLVRENILLCAALLGLIFSMSIETFNLKEFIFYLCQDYANKKRLGCLLVIFIVAYLALVEVIFSYGKKPFGYGYLCSIDRPLADDGWISGIYKILVPVDTIKVNIPIYAEGVGSSSEGLKITFSILGLNSVDGGLQYVLRKQGWTSMDILVSIVSTMIHALVLIMA